MRHRIAHRKLNRTKEHRLALRRNMVQSLIEHGQIRTTVAKAKDLRPFVEKIITLAKAAHIARSNGDAAASLRARRQIERQLTDRSLVPAEHREDYEGMSYARRQQTLRMASGRRYRTGAPRGRLAFTGETIMHRLLETVAPRFEERPGGYTRVILLPDRRVGDHSQLALLQLVGEEQAPTTQVRSKGRTARRRRADARYAAYIKAVKGGAAKPASRTPEAAPAHEATEESSSD